MPEPTLRTPQRFPFHVEPQADEALLSWLLRLTTRARISMRRLTAQAFHIDALMGQSAWWCRPHPWLLKCISERTGIRVAHLRRMTFESLEPSYRDDEAPARFAGRRYDTRTRSAKALRFAVCGLCLKSDATPYLRTSWLIGWIAACPIHGVILIERCKACHARVRIPPLAQTSPFSPAICTRCGQSLLNDDAVSAHPSVARLQAALWQGKRSGALQLEGLGSMTWKEFVALADVLIGMIWTDLTLAEQERIFLLYSADPLNKPQGEDSVYDGRHGSLRLLAWLIEGWPSSPGAEIAQQMLVRWLTAARNRLCRHLRALDADYWTEGPSNFELPIRERLRVIAHAT